MSPLILILWANNLFGFPQIRSSLFVVRIRSGHPRRMCAYPPSKTAVAIYFVQLVICFVQLATNCHPLSWCIQKHHSQRRHSRIAVRRKKGIFSFFSSELLVQNISFTESLSVKIIIMIVLASNPILSQL